MSQNIKIAVFSLLAVILAGGGVYSWHLSRIEAVPSGQESGLIKQNFDRGSLKLDDFKQVD